MLAQDLIAGLIALAALAYLVRRRLRSRGAACEGCARGGCAAVAGAERGAPPTTLVTIEGFRTGDAPQPPARKSSR